MGVHGRNHPNSERKLSELAELALMLGLPETEAAVRRATSRAELQSIQGRLLEFFDPEELHPNPEAVD